MTDRCPTCGATVVIVRDPDGTSYFAPPAPASVTVPELAAAAIDSETQVIRLEARVTRLAAQLRQREREQ